MPRVVAADRIPGGWALDRAGMAEALNALESGGLVVYPTETLYGLGADPYDRGAMARLGEAKGRPADRPISVAVANLGMAQRVARFNNLAEEVWRRHMPGPLTVLLKPTPRAPPPPVTAGGLIGLRMPNHGVALALAGAFGPITATSANLHDGADPVDLGTARGQLGDKIALYIDAGPCVLAKGSTVVDLSTGELIVKREGALGRAELLGHG